MGVFRVTKEFTFDAAHKLSNPALTLDENLKVYGKCNNLHGHTYKLAITVEMLQPSLENGMVINFSKLKEIVENKILFRFDHTELKDIINKWGKKIIPTVENLAEFVFKELEEPLIKEKVVLVNVRLYETPTSWVDYSE